MVLRAGLLRMLSCSVSARKLRDACVVESGSTINHSALTRQEGQEPQDAADSAEVDSDGPPLTDDELKMLGVSHERRLRLLEGERQRREHEGCLDSRFERLHALGTVSLPHARALHAPNHVHAQAGHAARATSRRPRLLTRASSTPSLRHEASWATCTTHSSPRVASTTASAILGCRRPRAIRTCAHGGARATRWLSRSCTTRAPFSK